MGSILGRSLTWIIRALNLIGVATLIPMMLLSTADVTGRYFFGRPVKGTMEIIMFMLVASAFLGLAYTESVGGHVRVKVLVQALPRRVQTPLEACQLIVMAGVVGLLAWQSTMSGLSSIASGEMTDVLRVPLFPFRFLVPLGALFLCLELLRKFLRVVRGQGTDVQEETLSKEVSVAAGPI